MDDSHHQELVLLGGLIGSIITAFFAGLTMILNAWWKARGQQRTTQFTEQGQIIDRQEKQIARLEAQIHEQQEAIGLVQREHLQCREESAQLRIWLAMLREDMIRAGMQPRDLPDLARHEPQSGTDVGFVSRQTEQTTNLLTRVDEHLKQEPPAGGGHAGFDH